MVLITFANSLDQNQDRQNVSLDLELNSLTLLQCSWKNFLNKSILKKVSRRQQKYELLPSMQRDDLSEVHLVQICVEV